MKNVIFTAVLCLAPAALCAQQTKLLETQVKEPAPAEQKPAAVSTQPAAAPEAKPALVQSPLKKALTTGVPPAKKAVKKPAPAAQAPVKEAAVIEPVKEPVAGAGFAVGKKHVVSGGDTLWDLSGKYYSDPFKWGKIYNANLSTVENPDRIYPKEELVIPDITEEVKPEVKAELKTEPAAADTFKEAELSSTDVAQKEETPQEEAPAPAAAPAAAAKPRVKAPPPAAGEFTKTVPPNTLSETMPSHQKEWSTGSSMVPAWWKEDGVVTAKEKGGGEAMDDSLTMGGEMITVAMNRAGMVTPGDYLAVYLKGSDTFSKIGKTSGKEIQYAGMAEVVSADGATVRAVIIDAVTAISKGYIVKKK
jgi:nucleoid-associated protein YgaU